MIVCDIVEALGKVLVKNIKKRPKIKFDINTKLLIILKQMSCVRMKISRYLPQSVDTVRPFFKACRQNTIYGEFSSLLSLLYFPSRIFLDGFNIEHVDDMATQQYPRYYLRKTEDFIWNLNVREVDSEARSLCRERGCKFIVSSCVY